MIYFCIPAYNEGRTIGVLLWKIRQVMTEFPRDYRILVVDDASTDGTPEVLEPYARVLPLKVLRHDERQGYAASLEQLLRRAVDDTVYPKRDVIVVLQADFTDSPEAIPDLLKRIESGADLVTSTVTEADVDGPLPVRWLRRLIAYALDRFEWPDDVSDPRSGFRAYRIICVRKALEDRGGRLLEWEGWAANAELLQKVIPHARRIEEVEIEARPPRRQRPTRLRPLRGLAQLIAFFRARGDRSPEVGAALERRRGQGRRRGKRRRSDDAGARGRNGGANRTPSADRAASG